MLDGSVCRIVWMLPPVQSTGWTVTWRGRWSVWGRWPWALSRQCFVCPLVGSECMPYYDHCLLFWYFRYRAWYMLDLKYIYSECYDWVHGLRSSIPCLIEWLLDCLPLLSPFKWNGRAEMIIPDEFSWALLGFIAFITFYRYWAFRALEFLSFVLFPISDFWFMLFFIFRMLSIFVDVDSRMSISGIYYLLLCYFIVICSQKWQVSQN